ncbi:MAG TPA: dephospho-CoA kinase [Chloroflexota bacterium]|nr:dephospho-CoA kinase [Chloroflexota bacterium]
MTRTIGLTGNIACGKSTVASVLRELGAHVIDADKVAHAIMAPPGPVFRAIVHEFGRSVVAPDGSLDRRKLGGIVFSDASALRRLDAIVHSEVSATIRQEVAQATEDVVVVEAIKLIESGTLEICDAIWVVTCQPVQQIERLVGMRNLAPEDAEQRVRAQGPVSAKLAYATDVIDASGTLADTRQQVLAAWTRFTASPGATIAPSDSFP